jgi:hypothetical protein
MKVLIAVPSCHSLKQYEEVIQSTWGKDIPPEVDLRFFLGNPEVSLAHDEVFLKVEDGFDSLTNKTVALYAWALEQGYEFVFKCDLDTLVRPRLLLASGFEAYDWVGGANSFFASGGAGYVISRKAMQYVVDAGGAPGFEEDVHIARILLSHGIELHNDPRFKFCPGDVMDDHTITYHLSSVREWYFKGYRPEMMSEAWADQKTRNYKSYAAPLLQMLQKRVLRRFR